MLRSMISGLQNRIKDDIATSNISSRLLLLMFSFLAVLPHIIFVIYFFISGIRPLWIAYLLCILYYCITSFLIYNKRIVLGAVLIVIESVFISVYATAFLGSASLFHWYMALLFIPFLLYVETSGLCKALVCCGVAAAMVFCILYDEFLPVVYPDLSSLFFLGLVNTLFVFAALILECLMESISKKFSSLLQTENMEKLRLESYQDPLTGLFNRRYAEVIFGGISSRERLERGGRLCLAIGDLDDFKLINDERGHDAGDEILTSVSEILKSGVRKDDFVFRWGGEEFMIILQDAALSQAETILNGLRERVSESVFEHGGFKLRISITFGVTEIKNLDFNEAIIRADSNLYDGKKSGKNKVVAS